mmetsp:Transcript_27708/g.27931  ORF Transcript_27708/g.27931 Transcript_27708/m.27931 type:complete len:410 (+) Transcript_27708:433-1662(+)
MYNFSIKISRWGILITATVLAVLSTFNQKMEGMSPRVFNLTTSVTDLHHFKSVIDIQLSKYPTDDHIHRCQYASTRSSRWTFLKNEFKISHPIMVHSMCFGYGSLGNILSQYIENRICANITGLHYITVQKTYPYKNTTEDIFLTALPSTVLHAHPNPHRAIQGIEKACPCNDMCHEYEDGLLHTHLDQVRDIFLTALDAYWRTVSNKTSLTTSSTAGSSFVGNYTSDLPLVPDVAIHYRCGDNLVGHYGFLPFHAFKKLVPDHARHIYVMCESATRFNPRKKDQRIRCEIVLKQLHSYLVGQFPQATVLLLRGQDIVLDLYRLTYAQTTICSVSTFCLWPAISSSTTAYFPVTRLVAKTRTPDYGPHFKWIFDPPIVHGVKALKMSYDTLIKALKSKSFYARFRNKIL